MKKNQKANLARFEVLKEAKTGNLIGGFSNAIGNTDPLHSRVAGNVICTNNCDGGNCVKGCGGAA